MEMESVKCFSYSIEGTQQRASSSPASALDNEGLVHRNSPPASLTYGCRRSSQEAATGNSCANGYKSAASTSEKISAEVHQGSERVFKPLSDDDIRRLKLEELQFKPLMLRTWFLSSALTFNSIVLALLIVLIFAESISFINQWGYFAIQILPPIIGTITASFWGGITLALSRITPFMLCASPGTLKKKCGDTAGRTVLREYFPAPSLRDIAAARNKLLAASWLLLILSSTVLAFKSSLLNTVNQVDYWEATVAHWSLYPLIGIYALMNVTTILLIFHLHNKPTGLRPNWDTVSIADHLVLLSHSNFLDDFEGTDISTRESIFEYFQHQRLRLGYWDLGGGKVWHGFGKVEDDEVASIPHRDTGAQSNSNGNSTSSPARVEKESHRGEANAHNKKVVRQETYSKQQISQVRYRSVWFNMQHWVMYIWTAVAVIFVGLFVAALAVHMESGITINLSYNVTSFIFQFLVTFVIGLYTWFWEDVDMFCRSTQPYIGLAEPKPAHENLLLDYNCQPPGIITYMAIKNGHWKIVRTSLMALLQRLLPILVGGSITVVDEMDGSCTVYASFPLFVCAIAWLVAYSILIPFEVTEDNYNRHLPRNYVSIMDIISWCYDSGLLHNHASVYTRPDLPRDNFFDISNSEPDDKKFHLEEQWYMEARLRLAKQKYRFGLYGSTKNPSTFRIGIDEERNSKEIDPPDSRTANKKPLSIFRWIMRRQQRHIIPLEDRRGAGMVRMSDTLRFVPLLDGTAEHTTATTNMDQALNQCEEGIADESS